MEVALEEDLEWVELGWIQVEKSGKGLFCKIRPSREWVWLTLHLAEALPKLKAQQIKEAHKLAMVRLFIFYHLQKRLSLSLHLSKVKV